MTTLNEVTQRIDQTDFNTYKLADWAGTFKEMTDEEKDGLQERLVHLEEKAEAGEDMMENFDGLDEFDEMMILRSLFSK